MEFGLQLNGLELSRLHDVAQAAEALGFSFLTLPDHYLYEGPERASDPMLLNFDPMLAAAVMAQATKTARIGHLVLCNLFRHPLETARAISTLDHLSGGRMVLGIGSGWTATEFEMTGIPFPDITPRLAQLDESLHCIRSLWTNEKTTFDGAHYHLRDAVQWPKPVQQPTPPILLGGGGKGLLRIAAKHADIVNVIVETGKAGYITLGNVAKLTDEAFRTRVAFLHQCAREAGRDPGQIRISNVAFNLALTSSPAESQERAQMLASLFQNTPEGIMQSPSSLIGTPDELIAEIRRRQRAWGISQLVFSFQGESVMRRLGEAVLPAFKEREVDTWELVAREHIRDTVARYTHCADKGRFDELAQLFLPDGILDIGEERAMQGRDGILAFLGGQRSDLHQTTGTGLVRHHVTNLRIDVESPTRARGVAYFLVVTSRGPDHWGQYRDVYAASDDRWRFAERRVKLEGYAADSWVGTHRRNPG